MSADHKILVWCITPDPQGIFDTMIVGSAAEAGEVAARAAELSFDSECPEDLDGCGPSYSIACMLMARSDFDELPEP
jgi:hypothetical protein